MKWYITRKRLLGIILILFTVLVLFGTLGCTKREEQVAKETAGAVSRAFGLPPFVGESLVTAVLSIATYLKGQQNGRRKERSCHVQKPQPAKVDTP